ETKIPDRTYTISDFTKVELGMTYEKVVELMGEPTGSVGSGIVWQTYMLLDGSYVKLFFGSAPPYSDSWLVEIYIVDPSGREFELKQD
ncbi:MAG: hypothetical protein FWH51_03510, partial [Dehalococcoidia bacterium]|nr:hypothetical protein [Dehalococcoidia bacterium]